MRKKTNTQDEENQKMQSVIKQQNKVSENPQPQTKPHQKKSKPNNLMKFITKTISIKET